jgi:hypothetical protein
VIESWHPTVECELRRIGHFAAKAQTWAKDFGDYNTCRRHSACHLMPPLTYEKLAA